MRRPSVVRRRLRWLLPAVGLLLVPALADAQSDAPRYRPYAELTAELQRLARANGSLARLSSIGKTREGRDVWLMELAGSGGTPVAERPALLVAANFEGDHVVGSELALGVIRYFLTGYGQDEEIRERLDAHVLYVIPRMNPDAAEQMFAAVKSGVRGNTAPYDDDNDARTDEDGPEDLNGDGLITLMRLRDPTGEWVVDRDEPRLMKKAEPSKGEAGAFALYWEGVDNDHDGFYNEDWPGGVDLNRNFLHEYPYYAPDAGRHMVSEAESRGLLDFLLAHRNVAMVLTFGESDNLVSPPTAEGRLAAAKSVAMLAFADDLNRKARAVGVVTARRLGFDFRFGFGRRPQAVDTAASRSRQPEARPATTVDRSDLEYFTTISKQYRDLTGIKEVAATRAPRGAFFEYAYYQLGIPSFSTPGWGLPEAQAERGDSAAGEAGAAAPRRGPPAAGRARAGAAAAAEEGNDRRLLQWMDRDEVDGFLAWTALQHPEIGAVEIGGFKPYAITNPPVADLTALGESHGRFSAYLMSLFPRVRIADVKVKEHGAGIFEITADVENTGFLPTALAQGVRAQSVAPVMVQLDVPPEQVVTGAAKTSFIPSLNGSGARQRFVWVIKGTAGARVELRVRSQKSGDDTTTITLR